MIFIDSSFWGGGNGKSDRIWAFLLGFKIDVMKDQSSVP